MNSSCILCKLITGELPSFTLYEDARCKVILDRFPSSLGHAIVISKEHATNIFELNEEIGAEMFKTAMRIATAMKKVLGFDDMNLLQNNGEAAGQTIEHFHIHLIPRYKGDEVQISWKNQDPSEEDFEKLAEAIRLKGLI